ncbi:hypothetical protein JXI42_00530 [bacterium]|nr:hypothetical protein [bacterium]
MKSFALIVIITLLVAGVCSAQSTFALTFGGWLDDEGYSIIQTAEGNYIIAGISETFLPPYHSDDILLAKFNSSFEIDWTKTIGGLADEAVKNVIQTRDSGYVILGETMSFGSGGSDILVVKLNAGGSLEWVRASGNLSDRYGTSVIQIPDTCFVVVGWTDSLNSERIDYDILLVKFDMNGNSCLGREVFPAESTLSLPIRDVLPDVTVIRPEVVDVTGLISVSDNYPFLNELCSDKIEDRGKYNSMLIYQCISQSIQFHSNNFT